MTEPLDADVYVDVLFDDGLLFFVICNDGPVPAERVRVAFDHPVLGENGVDVTELAVFNRLEFLAPGKRIAVFIDRSQSYYARRQRSRVTARVTWRERRRSRSATMTHDMRVYADLPYVTNHPDKRRVGHLRR